MPILVSRASAATVSFSTPQEVIINKDDDSITVYQPTHDNLNANANIQVGNADVSVGNPVPTSDADTHTKLDTANTSLDNIEASVASIASNTDGLSKVNAPARIDYTTTNVTTAAYVQLVASLSGTTKQIHIFDSSGRALVLAVGGAGSEVDQIYIAPGGTDLIPLKITSGSRVSVKAVDATANKGQLLVSFLG